MKGELLTEGRRRLVAKTLMDLVKILVAAALASEFFARFSWPVRGGVGFAILCLFVLGIAFQPPDKQEKE